MHLNKRGVALLQVLIVAALLIGLSVMILRVVLSRSLEANRSKRTVVAQMLIEDCMGEVNRYLAQKSPEDFADAFANCQFTNDREAENTTVQKHIDEDGNNRTWTCTQQGNNPQVQAVFTNEQPDAQGRCQLTYQVVNGMDVL